MARSEFKLVPIKCVECFDASDAVEHKGTLYFRPGWREVNYDHEPGIVCGDDCATEFYGRVVKAKERGQSSNTVTESVPIAESAWQTGRSEVT